MLLRQLYQCRLEANYAHQQELDMIPLMMQKDYKPQGWRKSLVELVPSLAFVSTTPSSYHKHGIIAGSGLDNGHAAVVCDVGRGQGR